MTVPDDRKLLVAATELVAALAGFGLTPTIIGGIAVSLLTQSRQTDDVDALVVFDTAQIENLLDVLASHGFVPRFAGMADFGRRVRLITVTHVLTDSIIDIALGCMPFESELVERSVEYALADVRLRLPTPEDLVILKAVANRPKDREDIRTIARVYQNLDRKRVKFWVRQYGDLLDNPDLWRQVESLLDSAPG